MATCQLRFADPSKFTDEKLKRLPLNGLLHFVSKLTASQCKTSEPLLANAVIYHVMLQACSLLNCPFFKIVFSSCQSLFTLKKEVLFFFTLGRDIFFKIEVCNFLFSLSDSAIWAVGRWQIPVLCLRMKTVRHGTTCCAMSHTVCSGVNRWQKRWSDFWRGLKQLVFS